MYFSKLKEEHYIPMVLMRLCPSCKKYSVFVNTIGDFAYRCLNKECENKHYLEFIPCMMKHRNFQVAAMNVKLNEVTWVKPDGEMDLDHPESDIEYEEGPYKSCNGILVWDDTMGLDEGARWFKCNVCNALYRGYIFCYYSLNGTHMEHTRFKMEEKRDKPWEVKSESSNIPSNKSHKVPPEWALIIDKVKYLGEEVIYKKKGL